MNVPIRYNALGVYFSSGDATGIATGSAIAREINRVQSWSSDSTNNLLDVFQIGNLSALQRLPDSPDFTSNFEWYPTDGSAERNVGLVVTTGTTLVSAVSGILGGTTDSKNAYITIVNPAYDAAGYALAQTGCIALGNTFLTNYTVNGAIDSIVSATATFDALNLATFSGLDGTQNVPAITTSGTPVNQVFVLPQYQTNVSPAQPVAVIDYGAVVTISGAIGVVASDLKIQDFTLTLDLSRTPYSQLGQRYPYARAVNFPAPVTLSVTATVGDLSSGSWTNLLCQTGKLDASVVLFPPNCPLSGRGNPCLAYYVKGASLNTQNFSVSVSDPLTATFELGAYVGGANDQNNGLFISGTYGPFSV